MAKKKRTQKRWKKSRPISSDDLRKVGRKLSELSRYVLNWADDMDGASISEIMAIIEGIETRIVELDERMQIEFKDRILKEVRAKANEDAEFFGK